MQDFVFAPLFDETKPFITDPWGFKIKIFYRSASHPAVVEWEKERQRENPIFGQISTIQMAAFGAGTLQALSESLEGDAMTERARELAQEKIQKRLSELAAQFELTPEDAEKLYAAGAETAGRAAVMADGWEGVNDDKGHPVPFSRDAAEAFFSRYVIVPEGQPHAGESIGAVLAAQVIEGGRMLSAATLAAQGMAKKGSAPTTGADLSLPASNETTTIEP